MFVTAWVILNSSPVIEVKNGVASGTNAVFGICGVETWSTDDGATTPSGRLAAVLRIRNTPVSSDSSRSNEMCAKSTEV